MMLHIYLDYVFLKHLVSHVCAISYVKIMFIMFMYGRPIYGYRVNNHRCYNHFDSFSTHQLLLVACSRSVE